MIEGAWLKKRRVSADSEITCRTVGAGPPLLVIWGEKGLVHRTYDVLDVWREVVDSTVDGRTLPCGHFLPGSNRQERLMR